MRDNRILFTTTSADILDGPVDSEDSMFVPHVNTIIIENEEAMNYFFDMCVGTEVDIKDAVAVIAGFSSEETVNVENA